MSIMTELADVKAFVLLSVVPQITARVSLRKADMLEFRGRCPRSGRTCDPMKYSTVEPPKMERIRMLHFFMVANRKEKRCPVQRWMSSIGA